MGELNNMSEEKSFKHLLFDATVIIGIITVYTYYSGVWFYLKYLRNTGISNMTPTIDTENIFFAGGGVLVLLGLFIWIIVSPIYGYFTFRNKPFTIKTKRIIIFVCILLSPLLIYLLMLAPNTIVGIMLSGKKESIENKVIEIELKSGRKIENASCLKFMGKRDSFSVFLKDNGEVVALNNDEILMIKLKNTSK